MTNIKINNKSRCLPDQRIVNKEIRSIMGDPYLVENTKKMKELNLFHLTKETFDNIHKFFFVSEEVVEFVFSSINKKMMKIKGQTYNNNVIFICLCIVKNYFHWKMKNFKFFMKKECCQMCHASANCLFFFLFK